MNATVVGYNLEYSVVTKNSVKYYGHFIEGPATEASITGLLELTEYEVRIQEVRSDHQDGCVTPFLNAVVVTVLKTEKKGILALYFTAIFIIS